MLFKHILSIGLSSSLRFHLGLAFCPPCLCLCRPPSLLFLPSLSESLALFFSLSRLRVTGLLPWSLLFCV